MSIDLGASYREARERITAMVSDEVGGRRVPATPEWTVHDVVAHLAGVTEDSVTGNLEGAASDAWTAAQVERGRTKSNAELIALWEQYAPFIEGLLSAPAGARAYRAVLDICTHEADLQHALGRPLQLPRDVVEWVSGTLRSGFAAEVAAAGLPPVEVDASDIEWFRGRLGRRTVAEVCAYEWSADPTPYLDMWFVFGRAERSLGEITA